MDSKQISYIIAILFAVAILVILIVILSEYRGGDGTNDDSQYNTNVKTNWLYYLNIAVVGLIITFGIISLLCDRDWHLGGVCK